MLSRRGSTWQKDSQLYIFFWDPRNLWLKTIRGFLTVWLCELLRFFSNCPQPSSGCQSFPALLSQPFPTWFNLQLDKWTKWATCDRCTGINGRKRGSIPSGYSGVLAWESIVDTSKQLLSPWGSLLLPWPVPTHLTYWDSFLTFSFFSGINFCLNWW